MKNSIRAVLLLTGIAALSFLGGASARAGDEPRTITIQAHKFAFEPDTITVKKGETVRLQISSTDVKHGLSIKEFHVKGDVEPGKTTELTFTPDKEGTFEGQCSHFCGLHHGAMKLTVVVEP